MTGGPHEYRIGDRERDDAVRLLSDHHSAGRLTVDEFSDRMAKALEARTMPELRGLFSDLPGPRPGELLPLPPQQVAMEPYGEPPGVDTTPWYAQWWMILVAVGITVVFDGSFGYLIPMMAVWLWVIYPSMKRNQSPQVQMARRPLTVEEQQRVMAEVRMGRKIQAIKLYRELTGAGLKEAKDTVDDWERRQIGY